MAILLCSGTGAGTSYPASVVTKSLQAVWDLRVGGSATIGQRGTTKVLGVDSLAGTGFSYDGRFLTSSGAGSALSNWDLSTVASNGHVEVTGGTATFTDCKFGFKSDTSVSYNLLISGGAATCNYCTFDGGKFTGTTASSPFNVASGASLTMDHCDIVNQPADSGKSNGTLTITLSRFQAPGWDVASDPDGIQVGAGVVDVQNTLFDVRDGSNLGNSFTGQPLNNFFRAESFAGAITGVTFKNNVCVGILGYGSLPGAYTSIDAIDVNPNAISNVLYQNNVIQKGHSAYTYADGTTRYPHLTSGQWPTGANNNIDYDTGVEIPTP